MGAAPDARRQLFFIGWTLAKGATRDQGCDI
jgi:hypothetical protein